MSLEECDDNELPFGWERIDDPHYGTYFIDHVNRRTQFENPVIQAKQAKGPNDSDDSVGPQRPPGGSAFPPRYSSANPPPPNPKPNHANRSSIPRGKTPVDMSPDQDSHSTMPHINHSSMSNSSGLKVKTIERTPNRFFTRDPTQLVGKRIDTTLVKSPRGLGFTIVGGDDDDGLDEFLQIK
jgi:atrophin-1 interacting protein 3 (BAI1-associated protein 1)